VAALPNGLPRAETLAPILPEPSVAILLPQWKESDIQTVSAEASPAEIRITAINEVPVADCNQLHAAVARALASGKELKVGMRNVASPEQAERTLSVEPVQLAALNQAAAPRSVLARVTEGGNNWAVLREDSVRCKLMARVERQRRLLHVAVGLTVCWGPQVTLPKDVRASCNGMPLQCLAVAETLDALYSPTSAKRPTPDRRSTSFAAVSEREDYLVPSNYKRLQQEVDAAAASGAPTPESALASVPGLSYPGPAVLGDARALSAFLQQRQLYQLGEPERVGWLVFAGDALRDGQTIEIDIDLGRGPCRLTFTVPKA